MSKIQELFSNEKLLEKVATAETREDAKKICKEDGLELTDADLDAIAGGLSTTAKVLIGMGGAAAVGVGGYYAVKHFNGPKTREQKIGDHAINEIKNNAIKKANKVRDDRNKFRQSIAGEVKDYGEIFDVPDSSSGGGTAAPQAGGGFSLLNPSTWW